MELDEELAPAQRELVDRLHHLAVDPPAEVHARIMSVVRSVPDGRAAEPAQGARRFRRRIVMVALGVAAALTVGSGTALVASAHALPGSPAYGLRLAGEHLRLALASPLEKERLRLRFAQERLDQARALLRNHQTAVETELVKDSNAYLQDAQGGLSNLQSGQRDDVQNELSNLQSNEKSTEEQVGQQGQSPSDRSLAPGTQGNGGPTSAPGGASSAPQGDSTQTSVPGPAGTAGGEQPSPTSDTGVGADQSPAPGPDGALSTEGTLSG